MPQRMILLMASKTSYSIHNFSSFIHTIFPGGSDGKASVYNEGDPGSIPGLGRSLGEGNGNPLSILARRIPWTEEPSRFMGPQRVGHD